MFQYSCVEAAGHTVGYVCSVWFTVWLLWITEVVWCEKRSIATSVWDLHSEMRSTNHVTVTSVAVVLCWFSIRLTKWLLTTHLVWYTDAAFKSFLFFHSHISHILSNFLKGHSIDLKCKVFYFLRSTTQLMKIEEHNPDDHCPSRRGIMVLNRNLKNTNKIIIIKSRKACNSFIPLNRGFRVEENV